MIALDEVSARFQSHLEIEDNFRIILSGPYGIGKSYFLNDFFDKRKDKYNKIVISPVNYVVSANEDIFELIKVDIIVQMILNGTIEKTFSGKLSKIDSAAYFVNDKPKEFISFFTTLVKKISIGGVEMETDFFKGLFDLSTKYDAYKKKLANRLKTDYEKFGDFLNAYGETKGNIFEYNFITELINTTLNNLKSQKGEGFENVLIIDDLDRIDPEHIFRILNILSAHNNYLGAKNKFAFDKIILVCDIDNIQKIFAHRYGNEVDFKGYIDKFYSADIFSFSNTDAMTIYIDKLEVDLEDYDKAFLKFLLLDFIQTGKITLRQLLKVHVTFGTNANSLLGIEFSINTVEAKPPRYFQGLMLAEGARPTLRTSDISFFYVVKIAIVVLGSIDALLLAVKDMSTKVNNRVPNSARSVIKSMAFPFLLSSALSENRYSAVFYSLELVPGYDNRYNIAWPRVSIFNHTFRFRLVWNIHAEKFESGNYFEGMRVDEFHERNSYQSDSPSLPPRREIYTVLYEMIRTFRNNGIFEKAHL